MIIAAGAGMAVIPGNAGGHTEVPKFVSCDFVGTVVTDVTVVLLPFPFSTVIVGGKY